MDTTPREQKQLVDKNSASTQARTCDLMTKTTGQIVMISCITMVFLASGVGYGLGIMLPELVRVFEAPRAQAALVQSLFFAMTFGFAGILWTFPISIVGEGVAVIVGGVMSALGFIVSCFATSISTVIVFTGVVSGIGFGSCYFVPFFIIPEIFDENGPALVTLLFIGSSFGQIIISFIFETTINEYGLSGALLILGGLVLNTLPCGLLIYYRTRHILKAHVRRDAETKPRQTCSDVRRRFVLVVQDRCVCLFILTVFLIQQSAIFESFFIVDILVDRGIDRQRGSFVVSMLGVANIISRILTAILRIKLRFQTIYHWIYAPVLLALSHILVLVLRDYWSVFTACLLFTVCAGMLFSQCPVILLEMVGKDRYREGWAVICVIYGISYVTIGLIAGATHDATGTYDIALWTAAGAGLMATVVSILIIVIRNKNGLHEKAKDPYVLLQ